MLNSEAVGHVLSLMSSCGMSIYSGQFAFNVSSIFGFGFSQGLNFSVSNFLSILSELDLSFTKKMKQKKSEQF